MMGQFSLSFRNDTENCDFCLLHMPHGFSGGATLYILYIVQIPDVQKTWWTFVFKRIGDRKKTKDQKCDGRGRREEEEENVRDIKEEK